MDASRPADLIRRFAASPLARWSALAAWRLTCDAEEIVALLAAEAGAGFVVSGGVALHAGAIIEAGAVVKPPAVIGPACLVAAGAYLRGGVWLEREVIIGPGAELKSSFAFRRSKLAHLNFVGDSVLGEDVNVEAGAVIANYRNERADREIVIATAEGAVATGVDKFGALAGDGCRIGANAVVAPGAILAPDTVVPRLGLVDQSART